MLRDVRGEQDSCEEDSRREGLLATLNTQRPLELGGRRDVEVAVIPQNWRQSNANQSFGAMRHTHINYPRLGTAGSRALTCDAC